MERILKQLQAELEHELGASPGGLERVGTPIHRLKSMVEEMLGEIESNPRYDPFEYTNRLLRELDRVHRLKT